MFMGFSVKMMFKEAAQKGFTREWQDEAIVKDKCDRCLECWEDISMGISTEKDFEREREGLYSLVCRIAEKDPRCNSLINCHPKVLKVARIMTAKDKRLSGQLAGMLLEAASLLDKGKDGVVGALAAIEKAHEIECYLGRPNTLYEAFVEVEGERKHFIRRRSFKI